MSIIGNAVDERRKLEKHNESLQARLIWIKGFLQGLAERPTVGPALREDIHKALKAISPEKE